MALIQNSTSFCQYRDQQVRVYDTVTHIIGIWLLGHFSVVLSQSPYGLFQISDLEKEKTMLELEVKELIARHKTEIQDRSSKATQVC